MKDKKEMKVKVIIVCTILLFAGALFISYPKAALSYHRWRLDSLLNQEPTLDPSIGLSYYDENWSNAVDRHKDSLVRLGYFERREFLLEYISYPSLESNRFWQALRRAFPGDQFCTMTGTSTGQTIVVVYDTPDNIPKWEKVISPYNALPINTLTVESKSDFNDLLPFVGKWADEEEGVLLYTITSDSNNTIKIEPAQSPPWSSVIKNIHLEDNKILFDKYNYLDPNNPDFNNGNEHPFSGVRCTFVFETIPNDPNLLNYRLSSAEGIPIDDTEEEFKGELKRIE